jgi:Amidohydrolase family
LRLWHGPDQPLGPGGQVPRQFGGVGDQHQVALLAAARVSVVHNPVANMILGAGVCLVRDIRHAGIPVGLGTDGAVSNDSQHMLETVKAAALLQQVAHLDVDVITASDVLTIRLGGDRPSLANIHDPRQQVAYCGQAANSPNWPGKSSCRRLAWVP